MSIHQHFPPEISIRQAYLDVLLTSNAMEYYAESLEIEVGPLQDLESTFGDPSPEAQEALDELDEAEEDERRESGGSIDIIALRYGKLFKAIGVQLEIVDMSDLKPGNQLVVHNRIVPELEDPKKFEAYMGSVGIKGERADPTHLQLAEDVLEHIKDVMLAHEARLETYESVDNGRYDCTPHVIRGARDDELRKFRTLMPFYFNSEFTFMEAYSILESRLMNRPAGSL